jgi:ABC-type nitrate/sulfonate/bicarbonate transport system ATPase subunit
LQDFSHALPHELSGGMARRAALARALAPKPDLLLLDEPFTNLDMPLRKELYNELRQIWLEGVTCILVTHDIDEALELGTRLVLLKERPAVIREDREINSDKSNLKKEFLAWMEVGG